MIKVPKFQGSVGFGFIVKFLLPIFKALYTPILYVCHLVTRLGIRRLSSLVAHFAKKFHGYIHTCKAEVSKNG